MNATIVDSNTLQRSPVHGENDPSVSWMGAFALCGGVGTTQSSTIVYEIEPGLFVLPTPLRHDLVNVGTETLRAVAFFAAAMFTQTFDGVMLPPKTHVLGTPNRNG